jgi:hypothetical protein
MQIRNVYAEFFIILPLQFHDLDRHQFNTLELAEIGPTLPGSAERSSSFIVTYLGGHNRISPRDFGAHELWTFEHFAISGFNPGQSGTWPGRRAEPPSPSAGSHGTTSLEQESSFVRRRVDAAGVERVVLPHTGPPTAARRVRERQHQP